MQDHSTTAGRRLVAALLAAALLVAVATRVFAAGTACPVGTRVQVGRSSGEVAEIGTRAPHTGWARIVSNASPQGRWVDWHRVDVRSANGVRCAEPEDRSAVGFGPQAVDDDDPPPSPTPPGA